MKRQTSDRAYIINYRKDRKFVSRAPVWGDVMKYCQKEQVFWVIVYGGKNWQNVKMERIAAGRLWDVNDDMMKAYK
jgi:hypothetical protein